MVNIGGNFYFTEYQTLPIMVRLLCYFPFYSPNVEDRFSGRDFLEDLSEYKYGLTSLESISRYTLQNQVKTMILSYELRPLNITSLYITKY